MLTLILLVCSTTSGCDAVVVANSCEQQDVSVFTRMYPELEVRRAICTSSDRAEAFPERSRA